MLLTSTSRMSFCKGVGSSLIIMRNFGTVLKPEPRGLRLQKILSNRDQLKSVTHENLECACGITFGHKDRQNVFGRHFSNNPSVPNFVIKRQYSSEIKILKGTRKGREAEAQTQKKSVTSNNDKSNISVRSRGSEIRDDKEAGIVSSLLGKEVTNKVTFDQKEWKTIYRFNYIRAGRAIQKLKIYQTAFTCCFALPASVGLFLTGVVPGEHVAFMLGTSTLAAAMLYIMGTFCSRLIGVLYVSKTDNSLVRVAHLNFWGRREDHIFNKKEFIPFSELPDSVSDIYINVKFYSQSYIDKLHICLRYGQVYDKLEFEDIFGVTAGMSISEV